MDNKHEQHVPIKQAYAKYKADLNANYTDRCIKQSIEYGTGDILMIQKIKNRWACSKERLEYCDFKIIGSLGICMNGVRCLAEECKHNIF